MPSARSRQSLAALSNVPEATQLVTGGARLRGRPFPKRDCRPVLCRPGPPKTRPGSPSRREPPSGRGGAPFRVRARVAAGDFMGCKELFSPKPEKPAGQPGPGSARAGARGAGGARRALPGRTCSPSRPWRTRPPDSHPHRLLPLLTAHLSQAPGPEGRAPPSQPLGAPGCPLRGVSASKRAPSRCPTDAPLPRPPPVYTALQGASDPLP